MRNIIRFLVAIAFLATAIPAQQAQAADTQDKSKRTTKKKTADRSIQVDSFIDKNNNGVDDRKERKAVKRDAAGGTSRLFAAPKRGTDQARPAASGEDMATEVKPAPEKPTAPKTPAKSKTDKSKTDKSKADKKPVKKPD